MAENIIFKILKYSFAFILIVGISFVPENVKAEDMSPTIFKSYKSKANNGDSKYMYFLGVLHEKGTAPKASQKRAIEWYKKASEAGYLKATNRLILNAVHDKNYAALFMLLERAGTQGQIKSFYDLAVLYETGQMGHKDIIRAIKLYERAITNHYIPAYSQLAMIYIRGEENQRDLTKAIQLLETATKKGDPISQKILNEIDNVSAEEEVLVK